jgi:hypothetical protein
MAQAAGFTFHVTGGMTVDCRTPLTVQNQPVHLRGSGTINPDRSGTADLTIQELNSTIHFDGRLGGRPIAAPGGTSRLNVVSRNRLRAVWDMPNNQLVLDVVSHGQACTAIPSIVLKRGSHEYSLFDGRGWWTCSAVRVGPASCQGS